MKKIYNLIVAGSRTFNDYALLDECLYQYINQELADYDVRIVSGTASGADQLGEQFANNYNLQLLKIPAKWDIIDGIDPKHIRVNKYGAFYNSNAGFERNNEMASISHGCYVFWDGVSKGTANMIMLARDYNLELIIHRYISNINTKTKSNFF